MKNIKDYILEHMGGPGIGGPGMQPTGGPSLDMRPPMGGKPKLFINNIPPINDIPPMMTNINRNNKPNAFVIIKPGFLSKKEQFENILKNDDWNIISTNEITLSLEQAKELYKSKSKEKYYDDLCEYMSSEKCRYYILFKECEDPISDMNDIKDTCRKKWGKDDMKNFMHSSDSLRNVRRESSIVI